MYKLVGIGGRIRGKEFNIIEGENLFGRSGEHENQIDFDGVSKSHFVLKNDSSSLILEDLKSSNGTFLNNELITVKNVEVGDVIAIPNAIFKVVKINKKVLKLYDKDAVTDGSQLAEEYVPDDLVGKIKYHFEKRLMKPVYALNKTYEWSSLIFMTFFIFIIVNILLTMESTLRTSNRSILEEAFLRGEQYIDEVVRRNAANMANKNYQQMDVSFLEEVPGVIDYYVFDRKGRILRPISMQDSNINDTFSIEAKEFLESREFTKDTYRIDFGDSKLGVAKTVQIYNPERQRKEIVGYVSLIYQPASLREMVTNNRTAYLEALIVSTVIGMFFCAIIFYLTRNVLKSLVVGIEAAQSNKVKEVNTEYMMQEIAPLRSVANDMIFKIRELGDEETVEFDEIEDDSKYLNTLNELLKGYPGPGVVLNIDKNITSLNQFGEDVLGIRESMSEGVAVEELLRDQGLAATIISLCDQSAGEDGRHCSELYEINGVEYTISVVTALGKDNFPKGYLVSFNKDY